MLSRPHRTGSRTLAQHRFIEVVEHTLESDGSAHEAVTLALPDWCMIAASGPDGRFVLVDQHRHGIDAPSLEFAGGIIDQGESPEAAARRELREETGYEAREVVTLGWVHPNPALQGNRSFLFYAPDCALVSEPERHHDEHTVVVLATEDELGRAIGEHRMTHALAVLCAMRTLAHARGLGADR